MPELPEVETVKCGLAKNILGLPITNATIRTKRLRRPIPPKLASLLHGRIVTDITRRAKYLIFTLKQLEVKKTKQEKPSYLIIHLGMTGKLFFVPSKLEPYKHEHLTINFANAKSLRFVDARRFGAIEWTDKDPFSHPLLKHLGIEPLSKDFTQRFLLGVCERHRKPIKNLLMDSKLIVGIGNIYANEALFLSGIRPQRSSSSITPAESARLVKSIKQVLRKAIKCGGTTIRDFAASDGSIGNFVLSLKVYDRAGQPCVKCGSPLQSMRIGQRQTVYCKHCQK